MFCYFITDLVIANLFIFVYFCYTLSYVTIILGGEIGMKFGMRKPSFKKSLKARTTSKYKRKLKKAINPSYGKKGSGLLKNPKKSVYNKVYRKTSFSWKDLFK